MKKPLRLVLLAAVLCPTAAAAQTISVSQPNTNVSLKAGDDFATRAFQDPWDMSQKSDVGPFLGSSDQPASGFTNIAFPSGFFSGTTTTTDANLWLLDTGLGAGTAPLGKIGTNYPIDTGTFKVLAVRASVQNTAQMLVNYWASTIFAGGPSNAASLQTRPGWNISTVNLGADGSWTGTKGALRVQPAAGRNNENVVVDWARLVAFDASLCRTIVWNGADAAFADIFLDTDTNPANGHLGVIQPQATLTGTAESRTSGGCPMVGGAYNFYTGVLPAGTYRIGVVQNGLVPTAGNSGYAPGSWTINEAPTLVFTSPNEEGSADDFATTQLGNPWDMDALSDVDMFTLVNSPQITTLNMEAPDGSPLPNQRVLYGSNAAGGAACPSEGDPQVWPLWDTSRGLNVSIDANRYRILTVEFGVPSHPRSLVCGSVARVIWRGKGDGPNNNFSVTEDIIFNSRAGVNLLDKVTLDLKTINIEQGLGAGSGPRWINGPGGGINVFRFDPHEYSAVTPFYIKRIKLTSLEQAKATYTIRWNYSRPSGTVDLYYDFDAAGFDGFPIEDFVDATAGQYAWAIPPGLPSSPALPVYIYAIFRDSTGATGNANRVYAKLPLLLDSNYVPRPRAVVSRSRLNYGITQGTITTGPQTFRLGFVGEGPPTPPCWSIANSNPTWFTVSPTTGNGPRTITVSLVPQTFPGAGQQTAVLTINECAPNTILNPGLKVTAIYRIASSSAPPAGTVDTPANGVTIAGSIAMTGWVVDDVGVASVKIYRDPVAGEPAGRVYIGDAVRVDDARPDIEGAFPDVPMNYRAGWGYLLLSNFLPGLGDGTYVLRAWATDFEGRETELGSRTVHGANSASFVPFGAIDTPGQGETISGSSYNNFGWVLARGPARADPPLGTVQVYIDNVHVGSPTGWAARPDIQALFPKPTYPGVDNALGVFTFDTTAYADGVHTIFWIVFADNGSGEGVGSRYFNIVNGTSLVTETARGVIGPATPLYAASPNLGLRERDVHGIDASAAVRVGHGYSLRRASTTVTPDGSGVRTVYGRAMEGVTIDASVPGTHQYEAYLVAGGVLRPIPVGASFDERKGILDRQPGLGFRGSYDFVVVRDGKTRVPFRVVLGPAATRMAGGRRPYSGLFLSTF